MTRPTAYPTVRRSRKLFLFVLIAGLPAWLWAQKFHASQSAYLSQKLNKTDGAQAVWDKKRKALTYPGLEKKEKKPGKKSGAPKPSSFNPDLKRFSSFLRVLFGIAAVAFILYLVYRWMDARRTTPSVMNVELSDEHLDWIEENLPEADVRTPLDMALESGAYRKAIRLYYLLIIKHLDEAGQVHWQPDKTNRTYLNETAGADYHSLFRRVTRIFEDIWYGERPVSVDYFHTVQPLFQRLDAAITPLIPADDE